MASVIADDWTDPTHGSLQSPNNVDELGSTRSFERVWSATTPAGTYSGGRRCGDWGTSAFTVFGEIGRSGQVNSSWTGDDEVFLCVLHQTLNV
jgi:hypothetical protein